MRIVSREGFPMRPRLDILLNKSRREAGMGTK